MTVHVPVMPQEVLNTLSANQAGTYLDCTLGGGGHSRAILSANSKNIVHACDRDLSALERTEHLKSEFEGRFNSHHVSFADLAVLFEGQKFSGILADLGLSSDQLASGRGFSFADESLDMRMNSEDGITAEEVVNNFSESDLRLVLRRGGVEQQATQIAQAIIRNRPITNAQDLAKVINQVVKFRPGKKTNPSTVAFQAIRIEVNDELKQIETLLRDLPKLAESGCNLVVISFHSLEDKLVTRAMRSWSAGDVRPALWPGSQSEIANSKRGDLITKKALYAGEEEVQNNPRSRSARLRHFKFN